MNKTISVSIGGFQFNLEEKAYDLLKSYLEKIKHHLKSEESLEEIISDIESRIAELFQEIIGSSKNVIDRNDVEEIISIMGEAEMYSEESEQEESYTEERNKKYKKQLFRDPDHKIIGGVAAGIGHYFGINPLWIRLILLIILISGGGLLVYIVLWIIIPEARTTADKIKMHGDPITVENIKQKFNEFKESETTTRYKETATKAANKFSDTAEHLAGGVGKLVKIVVGIILLVIGVSLIIGMGSAFFWTNTVSVLMDDAAVNIKTIASFDLLFENSSQAKWFILGLLGVTIIPSIMLLIAGFKLIFQLSFRSKTLGFLSALLWVTSLLILIFTSMQLGRNFVSEESVKTISKPELEFKTLKVSKDPSSPYKNQQTIIEVNDTSTYFGVKKFDVEYYDGNVFALEVKKISKAKDRIEARKLAEDIIYNYSWSDSTLYLQNVYSIGNNKFRNQEVELLLKVPNNKNVEVDEDITFLRDRDFNERNVRIKIDGIKDFEIEVEEN